MGAHAIGRSVSELDARPRRRSPPISPGRARRSGRLAGARDLRAGARLSALVTPSIRLSLRSGGRRPRAQAGARHEAGGLRHESAGERRQSLLRMTAIIMLGVALPAVLVFRRFGLGAVLGYLVAGVADRSARRSIWSAAPKGKMGVAADRHHPAALPCRARAGNPRRLWELRQAKSSGFGLAQVVIAGLAISGVVFAFTGFSAAAAIAIGLPLALSSTAQVLPLLRSPGAPARRRLASAPSRSCCSRTCRSSRSSPIIAALVARAGRCRARHRAGCSAIYTLGAIVVLVLVGRYHAHARCSG